METVEDHPHSFLPSEWPFSDPPNVVAISTTRVFDDNYPILQVSHDYDGDWQILCGTTSENKHALVVCLGCAFQRDYSLSEVADLPRGWRAWRDSVGGPWDREQKEVEEDDS